MALFLKNRKFFMKIIEIFSKIVVFWAPCPLPRCPDIILIYSACYITSGLCKVRNLCNL